MRLAENFGGIDPKKSIMGSKFLLHFWAIHKNGPGQKFLGLKKNFFLKKFLKKNFFFEIFFQISGKIFPILGGVKNFIAFLHDSGPMSGRSKIF